MRKPKQNSQGKCYTFRFLYGIALTHLPFVNSSETVFVSGHNEKPRLGPDHLERVTIPQPLNGIKGEKKKYKTIERRTESKSFGQVKRHRS